MFLKGIHVTLLLLIASQQIPLSAALSASHVLNRTSKSWHRLSKRGALLARDLRISLHQISGVGFDISSYTPQKVVCARPDTLAFGGDATSTSPATSSAAPTASATPVYQLVESHVSRGLFGWLEYKCLFVDVVRVLLVLLHKIGENFFDGWSFFGNVDNATAGKLFRSIILQISVDNNSL